jgi:hypothetical protein
MPELDKILLSVWRQTLADGAKYVQIGDAVSLHCSSTIFHPEGQLN